MSTRFFSGRESWVFRANSVEELCGHHADLIGGALHPHEDVQYLLYSPLREADGGPFGVASGSGSHALAITGDRVIVSRDPHRSRISRTVRGVPLGHILVIEVGEALTLGWLVLRFAVENRVGSETVFFQSSGMDLFRTAVRLIRQNGQPAGGVDPQTAQWDRLLAPSPSYLRNQIVPVLLNDERPASVVHSDERWAARDGSAKCVSPHGVYAVTSRAVLLAESERPDQPGALVFAVRVVCVPGPIIRGAQIISRHPSYARIAAVVVQAEMQGVRHQMPVILDEYAADAFVQAIARMQP